MINVVVSKKDAGWGGKLTITFQIRIDIHVELIIILKVKKLTFLCRIGWDSGENKWKEFYLNDIGINCSSQDPLQDIWFCSKYPQRYLVHAKRSLKFCPVQIVHKQI